MSIKTGTSINLVIFEQDKAYVQRSLENGEIDYIKVPQLLRRERLFNPEGIFVGDYSYVLVPNNPNYEGSVRLLFDQPPRQNQKVLESGRQHGSSL